MKMTLQIEKAFHMWLDSLDEEYLVKKVWTKGLLYSAEFGGSFTTTEASKYFYIRPNAKSSPLLECSRPLTNLFEPMLRGLPNVVNTTVDRRAYGKTIYIFDSTKDFDPAGNWFYLPCKDEAEYLHSLREVDPNEFFSHKLPHYSGAQFEIEIGEDEV